MTNAATIVSGQSANEHLFIVYDDSILSAASRLELAKLVTGRARRILAEIKPEDISPERFIRRVYHLSTLNRNSRPTAEYLKDVISRENTEFDMLSPGATISVPALPPRVYTRNDNPKTMIRVANNSGAIAAAASIQQLGNTDGLQPLRDAREGVLTAIEIDDPRSLAESAWARGIQALLPRGAHAMDPGGEIQLHLAAAGEQCNEDSDWIEVSPFRPTMKERFDALLRNDTSANDTKLRAKRMPLVIVDWFGEPIRHGEKVLSVAKYVLNKAGLNDLSIIKVDLNPDNPSNRAPANNNLSLSGIFEEFLGEYYCPQHSMNCNSRGGKAIVGDARKWLTSKPTVINGIVSVNQLVFEAVLWKYLNKIPSFVNVSFAIQSGSLEVMQASYLASAKGFIVAAASNSAGGEAPGWIPQRAASVYPNFANVTYGFIDGKVLGATTNSRYNVIVTAMAPGCGFNYDQIKPGDTGTSFASPYVTTAAWLKFLIDGVSPSAMRRELVASSLPYPSDAATETEGAGFFDSARLLSKPSYLICIRGEYMAIKKAVLVLDYRKPVSGLIATEPFATGDDANLSFFRRQGKLIARVRRYRTLPPPLPLTNLDEYEVTRVMLEVSYPTGEAHSFTFEDMGTQITSITF